MSQIDVKPSATQSVQLERERKLRLLAMTGIASNASTAMQFSRGTFGGLEIMGVVSSMVEQTSAICSGNLKPAESMLAAQAVALDLIFTEMARRAAINMGEHLPETETYMTLALKAQSQCREALEVLAEIKKSGPKASVGISSAASMCGPE